MKNRYRVRRRGTALICVLVCGLIAITLGASAIRLSLMSARDGKQTLRLQQAQWLLEAGIQRAQLRFSEGNLDDEHWQLPAGALSESHATVQIEMTETDSESILVTVTAEYGRRPGSEGNIRRSFTFRQTQQAESGSESPDE